MLASLAGDSESRGRSCILLRTALIVSGNWAKGGVKSNRDG